MMNRLTNMRVDNQNDDVEADVCYVPTGKKGHLCVKILAWKITKDNVNGAMPTAQCLLKIAESGKIPESVDYIWY